MDVPTLLTLEILTQLLVLHYVLRCLNSIRKTDIVLGHAQALNLLISKTVENAIPTVVELRLRSMVIEIPGNA